jgi:hypothetical protein
MLYAFLIYFVVHIVKRLLKARIVKPSETSSVICVFHAKAIYNKDQLPLLESLETAVRRAGVWCEMVTSLQGHEPRSRGTFVVRGHYQTEQ